MAEENQAAEQLNEAEDDDPSALAPEPAPPGPPLAAEPADPLEASLLRMERHLSEIASSLESLERERRHKDFSPLLFIGPIAQALVVALLLWTTSDAFFAKLPNTGYMLIKLGFAGVLQMGALTAFLAHRRR